ncbi:MAG TPA: helix-turn-helix domain-containing protein [Solirubrobacteraceae bacterium]|nr:helix-turn-helix domain-containing protein [Solirubrobacteraceae bacterium]
MPSNQVPLYVRLGAEPSRRLEQAVAVSGRSKRQIVEEAVREHLDDQGTVVGRVALRESLPAVLTLEEAASMLRVPAGELEAAAAAGDVPGRRIGAEWRFAREALVAWLGDQPQTNG